MKYLREVTIWIDVKCRVLVRLFYIEELQRILFREQLVSTRFLCHWSFFFGGLFCFRVFGSVTVMVLKVSHCSLPTIFLLLPVVHFWLLVC